MQSNKIKISIDIETDQQKHKASTSNYIFWLAHRIPGMLTCPGPPIYNDDHDFLRKGKQSHRKCQNTFHLLIFTHISHMIYPDPNLKDHYKILHK